MHILIQSNGKIRCIYDEAIPLSSIGKLAIKRGSHVEPTQDGDWIADLSPVDGPLLGPFENRSDALKAERSWLENHWLVPAG